MTLRLTDLAPNFDAETTQGKINFHEWAGDSWVVYFHIPKILHPFVQLNLVHFKVLNLSLINEM